MDFESLAQQIINEMRTKGKLPAASPETIQQLTADYAERLEDSFNGSIVQELERLGKMQEFEKILDSGNQDSAAFLSKTIPNFDAFRKNAIALALKKITG